MNVLENLRRVCNQIKAVYGNMDTLEIRQVLSEKEIIKVNSIKIGLTHGFGPPNKIIDTVSNIFKNDKVDVIVFGHSHNPINETRSGILYFNPGSPTDKIFAVSNSYGILEIENGKIEGKIIRV